MTCSQCRGIEAIFDEGRAMSQASRYRSRGPSHTTRILLDTLKNEGLVGKSLLDIGGGVGTIVHSLLGAGLAQASSVEASSAYHTVSIQEADRRGLADRIRFYHGDFVELGASVPSADVVTLDRVICCYHDAKALLGTAAAHAISMLAVVYPRDDWWVRLGFYLGNILLRFQRCPFRIYVHPAALVATSASEHGLRRRFESRTFLWRIEVYGR